MNQFTAPWGKKLRLTSALVTILLPGMTLYYLAVSAPTASRWISLLPVGAWFVMLLFMVRGYTITAEALLIRRLLWTTRISLADFQSAQFQPEIMNGSSRRFGNGGGFSFTGWYWTRSLGVYRAYVTDLDSTVVLNFTRRHIVVSPAAPEEFVRILTNLHGCIL